MKLVVIYQNTKSVVKDIYCITEEELPLVPCIEVLCRLVILVFIYSFNWFMILLQPVDLYFLFCSFYMEVNASIYANGHNNFT